MRALIEAGLNFSASILGFLIAGFTIFATLTKPTLLVKMYDETHPKSKLNYLKHNFFAFMQVFATLLFLLAVCVLAKILGSPGGALIKILQYSQRYICLQMDFVKIVIIDMTYVFLGTLFYYSVMSLKSFIFNVYHVIITSVVWELNSVDKKYDQDV